MVPIGQYLFLSLALFIIGVIGVVTRRNVIIILMSIELILNAVNINLVAFSRHWANVDGQIFALFVITLAAAEAVAQVLEDREIDVACSRRADSPRHKIDQAEQRNAGRAGSKLVRQRAHDVVEAVAVR